MINELTELTRQVIAWAASERIPIVDKWEQDSQSVDMATVLMRFDRRLAQVVLTFSGTTHYCQIRLFDEHGRMCSEVESWDYRTRVLDFLKGNRRTVELCRMSTPFTNAALHDLVTDASRLEPGRWVFTATEVPEVEA